MKNVIHTSAGVISVEPTSAYQGKVKITVKPSIWPEVMLTISPEEAALIAMALSTAAQDVMTDLAAI